MRALLPLLIAAIFFSEIKANGGPVNPASVVRVGDVELLNMPNVEVVREDLHIHAYREKVEIVPLGQTDLQHRRYRVMQWK